MLCNMLFYTLQYFFAKVIEISETAKCFRHFFLPTKYK